MTRRVLVARSLRWYWRTNAAVVVGVAVAVSVLAGSLLVGDSVRSSLRRIAVERLGRTDAAILGPVFFRERLAADVLDAARDGALSRAAPLIAVEGLVSHAASGRRAGNVQVFGVDERFWRFHGVAQGTGPERREAYLSPALAGELGAGEGDGVVVRVRHASDIPAGALQGRRDDLARSFRVSARTLPPELLGEFSLSLGQGPVRSVFVPLERLQRELLKEGEANVVLLSVGPGGERPMEAVDEAIARAATLEDLGLSLKAIEDQHALSVESRSGFIDPVWQKAIERAAREAGIPANPVVTYIANTIRIGGREIPYSVVTGMDFGLPDVPPPAPGVPAAALPPIWLNEWAARELDASAGDSVTLEYYRWSDQDGLATGQSEFALAGVVPMSGAGGDRTLTPDYPGLTDAPQIGDWDPPFPVDLRRIQPRDERYWDEYRTAPKAFVTYEQARQLWASRFGDATSIRLFVPPERPLDEVRRSVMSRLTGAGAPLRPGLDAHPVRERALTAAQGATDFGEYFLYFSFFLFVSGLILAVLFFKLGIEQRAPQIGLLQAMGFTPRDVRGLFLAEGGVLAVTGAILGVPGAIGFCALILTGLRTWWIDAVGTAAITLDVRVSSLAIGAIAGLAAAFVTTLLSLRALRRATARTLIAGGPVVSPVSESGQRLFGVRRRTWIGLAAGAAVGLIVLAALDAVPAAAAFFGAGSLLLTACVLTFSSRLRQPVRTAIHRPGVGAVLRLGARQTSWRPARSVLVATLVAAATFVIVAVGAFRRDTVVEAREPQSGTGGFPLFAESVIPLMHDLSTAAGRAELGFGAGDERLLAEVAISRFRLRPGDEGSCLNLYKPGSPRILAPSEAFLREGRFTFSAALEGSEEERANPWLLLDRTFDDGAVPVIGDGTSLTYVLHVGVGDDVVIPGEDGTPIVLRVVAALSHSMLQSELLIAERQFLRLFSRREGHRFFLIDAPPARQAEVTSLLEDRLTDAGFDVQSSVERLRAYERVERTYLSTFQTLGGLGLVIGTFGLGAVLLRNVLERRRELALLRAVGYRPVHLRGMVLAESLLVLGAGVLAGTASAVLAVAPALWARGGGGPGWTDTVVLLAIVVLAGVLSSVLAARAATGAAPVSALRSE